MRRLFDLAFSLVALVVLVPLFAIVALLVKVSSRGPVLYQAERAGKDGRPFRLYKFRSMYAQRKDDRARLTRRGDSRVTPIGRILRASKIDELPQLFNVLIGEMSIVGPRPEDPRYVALYSSQERQVLAVRPGITSPASIAHRSEEALLDRDDWEQHYIDVIMRDKLRSEIEYIERRTFASDIGVILRTLASLIYRTGKAR